jgi:hypothetical protein
MQLAAEAVAAGDVTAIAPYLKVLDRLDRYQTVAGANQTYDDDARKKLLDKINRVAANLGVDEVMQSAALEHLKKLGEIVDEESQSGADRADDASLAAVTNEAPAPAVVPALESSRAQPEMAEDFVYLDWP